ncbi:MAG: hypothetical protein AMJ78_03725 [Omnitrophica WOR_2 bacterium SM23_29]|nr:MAG: hypothetical protein AMJ78_03725 [Omnitrophica WOR_2 bacterium SM23_29]
MLDCDPGIDDSLAILLALASNELEIKAITTVFGNAELKQTTKNALNVLELSKAKNIPPVGEGSGQPLKGTCVDLARGVHGNDGLGNRNLPQPKLKVYTDDGIGLIISKLNSGQVDTIIATGPLTNLARAISRNPEVLRYIKTLYIMGGAVFVEGNVTPHAEFNFYSDPDAADYVLNSNIPIVLISLDVTHKVNVTERHIEPLKKYKNRLAEFVVGVVEYSIEYHRAYRGAVGAHLHDPLAVAIAVEPKLGSYEWLSLGVDCTNRRGMVQVMSGTKNVRFVKEFDVEGFLKLFLDRIGGAIEAIQNL